MLRFMLANGGATVSVDPKSVATVLNSETEVIGAHLPGGKALRQVAYVTLTNGLEFMFLDPNRTVMLQIEEAKK